MGMILVWILMLLIVLAVPACLIFAIVMFIRRGNQDYTRSIMRE